MKSKVASADKRFTQYCNRMMYYRHTRNMKILHCFMGYCISNLNNAKVKYKVRKCEDT